MSDNVLNIGVVGAGYWGKNIVRNFANAGRCNLKYVCDLDERLLAVQKKEFPSIEVSTDLDVILNDAEIDAVAVSTDVSSHYEIARKSLAAGKHTYVEKPMTTKAEESRILVETAREKRLKLMVGHLLEYHPAIEMIKEMIETGQIGETYYMYTQRVNLGIIRRDENAWWSLAPHDISIICYLFGSEPVSVAAHGRNYLQKDIEDVVFATVKFSDGKMANIQCSWLDPHKIRKMTVVGSKKMITFDDMAAGEKIRVCDKGVAIKQDVDNEYGDAISLRFGNIVIPPVSRREPLAIECQHFVDCVLDDAPIRSDGLDGLRVVRILEAGQRSLRENGRPINLEDAR